VPSCPVRHSRTKLRTEGDLVPSPSAAARASSAFEPLILISRPSTLNSLKSVAYRLGASRADLLGCQSRFCLRQPLSELTQALAVAIFTLKRGPNIGIQHRVQALRIEPALRRLAEDDVVALVSANGRCDQLAGLPSAGVDGSCYSCLAGALDQRRSAVPTGRLRQAVLDRLQCRAIPASVPGSARRLAPPGRSAHRRSSALRA